MSSFLDGLLDQPLPAETAVERKERWKEAVRHANASAALEGLYPDDFQFSLQAEIINETITTDEAIARTLAHFKSLNNGNG
jgi:hypothetical protein